MKPKWILPATELVELTHSAQTVQERVDSTFLYQVPTLAIVRVLARVLRPQFHTHQVKRPTLFGVVSKVSDGPRPRAHAGTGVRAARALA